MKHDLRAGEREFMRSVRTVASGTGRLKDLKIPLATVRAIQQNAKIRTTEVTVAALVEEALNAKGQDAGNAIAALTENIIVKDRHIEISFRKGALR
jgi:hypothetical protein